MPRRTLAATLSALAVLLAPAVPATAAVRVGTSGWSWGNPTPTGSDIAVIGFSGARGYAAGAFGTLLRTDDGGATWSGLPTGLLAPLKKLQVITPDVFVVAGDCAARLTTDGGSTFTRLYFTSGICSDKLAAMSFTSTTNGYLVLDDGTIVFSSDGGQTWTAKTAIPGTRAAGAKAVPTDIAFATDAIGVALSTGGKIYRTTDGAGSWVQVSDTSRAVNDVTMVSATAGFAVGDNGLFLVTADGGQTWTPKSTGADDRNLTSVTAASTTAAMATSSKGDFVLQTTDGGTTFSRITAQTQPTRAVAFSSSTRVIAAGDKGGMAASNDGGATFTALGSPRLTGVFSSLRSAPGGAAFATGENGALARTTDGGQTWSKVGVPTSQDMRDVSFPTAQTGYGIDDVGKLFKSTNGGTSWANIDTGTTAAPAAVYAPTTDVVMLIGPTGVRRSGDGAETFTTIPGTLARTSLANYDTAGAAVFVFGSKALLRSTDRGKTWKALKLPAKKFRVDRADFVSATVGYLSEQGGYLWKTVNGGKRWTEVRSVGTDAFYGMSFASARSGYLVFSEFGDNSALGYLLRTDDGGKTWAPQLVTDASILGPGIAAGATSYALDGNGRLLFSGTGGRAGTSSTVTVTPSSKRLRKPGRIRVAVAVKGARQGDVAVVSVQKPNGGWESQEAEVDRAGKATTSWDLRRGESTFVGQWAGNEASAGAGSTPVVVRVG